VTDTIKFLESSSSSSSSVAAAARDSSRDDQRLANWHFFSVLKIGTLELAKKLSCRRKSPQKHFFSCFS
jgi:hypothetical protein